MAERPAAGDEQLPPAAPGAGLRDVAALAGVSVGTVSNVLNQPSIVSKKTVKRVQEAIAQLGYVRNNAASQLRSGRSRSVGLIVLDVRNPFFTDLARGAEDALAEQSRSLLLVNSGEDAERELMQLDMFEEQRVDGLLISPVGDIVERLDRMRARGISVVLVDRLTSTKSYTSVAVDDLMGGQLATDHLLETGRRRLAFVGGPQSIEQVVNRHAGAQAAIDAFGAGTLDYYELESMNSQSARPMGEQLAALPPLSRPDGVFAANDLIALGLLQAFVMAGLRVPDDIALIGYDDIDYAASAIIPLSSIRQPSHQMGRRAAQLLLAEIEDPGSATPEHIVFEPELVVRASTRP